MILPRAEISASDCCELPLPISESPTCQSATRELLHPALRVNTVSCRWPLQTASFHATAIHLQLYSTKSLFGSLLTL